MRSFRTVALALAACLASGAAAAQPRAPDQGLGVALMSALVAANGTLQRGSGAVSVVRVNTGIYDVTFDRNIQDCVAVANAATPRFARIESYTGSVIQVRTVNGMNQTANNAFSMLVFVRDSSGYQASLTAHLGLTIRPGLTTGLSKIRPAPRARARSVRF